MKTLITKGLEKDEAMEIRQMFKASRRLRERVKSLLNHKVDEHFKAQTKRENYEEANWAFAQADSMGYCRALKEVVSMLSDDLTEPSKPVLGRPRKDSSKPLPLI